MQRTVTIELTYDDLSQEKRLPSFHEEVATLEGCPITRIGRSITGPFVYYLFGNTTAGHGLLVGTINVQSVVEAVVGDLSDQFEAGEVTDDRN